MAQARRAPGLRPRYRPRSPWARVKWPALFLLATLVYGTVGYMVVEDWSFVDAVYMVLMTLTTVGFGEVRPLDQTGRLITISVMIMGVGGALITLSLAATAVADELVGQRGRRKRMERKIGSIKDHFIVCAYGRVGHAVVNQLTDEDAEFVVVDRGEDTEEQLIEHGYPYVRDDATQPETLRAAGIERARGLVCALPDDPDNVYIALAARSINPHITIVSRASTRDAKDRLRQAGVDHVISPYETSGRHMALAALGRGAVEQ